MTDFPASPKVQICYGILACTISHTSIVWSYVSPVLTAIATLAGCFVALHGTYLIIKGWIKNGRQ